VFSVKLLHFFDSSGFSVWNVSEYVLREWNRTYGQTGLLNLRFLNTQQGMDQNLAPLICLLDRHQLPSPIIRVALIAPSIEFVNGIAKDHVVSFDRTTAMIEQIAKVV
jgi:hypothetical protein